MVRTKGDGGASRTVASKAPRKALGGGGSSARWGNQFSPKTALLHQLHLLCLYISCTKGAGANDHFAPPPNFYKNWGFCFLKKITISRAAAAISGAAGGASPAGGKYSGRFLTYIGLHSCTVNLSFSPRIVYSQSSHGFWCSGGNAFNKEIKTPGWQKPLTSFFTVNNPILLCSAIFCSRVFPLYSTLYLIFQNAQRDPNAPPPKQRTEEEEEEYQMMKAKLAGNHYLLIKRHWWFGCLFIFHRKRKGQG